MMHGQDMAKAGLALQVEVGSKLYPCTIEKLPFVPAKYYKP